MTVEKADQSKGYQIPKRKWVTTHFSEIIEHKLKKLPYVLCISMLF